jgi:signal transduction histidine kinase
LTNPIDRHSRSALGEKARLAAWGLLAAAPAFIAYANFILNHFYRYGAVLLDTAMFADVVWHKPASLPMSPLFHVTSFYALHIAPILTLMSALSSLFPLSMVQWFALFTGVAQALPAVAVFWILTSEYGLRDGWRIGLAALLAIAFSFNGLAIAQVRYPHFEIVMAASLMLFLVAWWRRRFVLAAVFFALALLCREDAGFHAVAVLGVVVAMNRWNGVPLSEQKPALIFLAVGFVYSAGALMLASALFPGHSTFVRVYLGTPPFVHVDGALVKLRGLVYLFARTYIFLPAACALAWAIVARNPYLLIGYIAFIPWTVLHLFAKSDIAGTLSGYYGFPFLIAAFWPLIGWRMKRRPSGPWWEPLAGFGVMILASFTALSAHQNPSGTRIWEGFTDPPAIMEQARVEQAATAILADRSRMGRILAGGSIAALRPWGFRPDETFQEAPPGLPDTLVNFSNDRDQKAIADLAAMSGLGRIYAVPGTPIRVITNREASDFPALGPLLTASR